MKIVKNSNHLFLKIPNYGRNIDVIEEHIKIYNEYKEVFIFKMGRNPSASYLNELIANNGCIIFKSHSKFGNKFYIGKVVSIGENEKMNYPEYYNEIFENMNLNKSEIYKLGVWYKINNLVEISENIVNIFKTSKDKELYKSALRSFQTPFMYIKSTNNLEV